VYSNCKETGGREGEKGREGERERGSRPGEREVRTSLI